MLYGIYNTPIHFHGVLGYALNDYEIAPDYQIQSGLPYSAGTTGSTTHLVSDSGATVTGISTSLNGTDGPARIPFEVLGEGFNLANHQNVTPLNTTAYTIGSTPGTGNTLTFNTQGGAGGTPVTPAYQFVTNSNSNGFTYTPRQLQLSARFQF